MGMTCELEPAGFYLALHFGDSPTLPSPRRTWATQGRHCSRSPCTKCISLAGRRGSGLEVEVALVVYVTPLTKVWTS